jgi:prevent-host-death family protein
MTIVTIHKAKTTLSQLIARAEAGEEIVLARRDQPVAKLVPIKPVRPKRQPGALKGLIKIGPEFFEPMTEEELKEWE